MEHNLFHIVAASGEARVIGNQNKLPWPKFSEDLKFFKATTAGQTIIMGRKTFESVGKKPLPQRENFVISRSTFEVPEGVKLFHSLEDAINSASHENIFIMGGANLYEQTINKVNGIFLTEVEGLYPGDKTYPKIPPSFKKNEKKSKELQERFSINVTYLENTATS